MLQGEASAAAGQGRGGRLGAAHAAAGSAPGCIAPSVEGPARSAARLADRGIVGGSAAAARCAESCLLPRAAPAPVCVAVGTAAPFRVPAGVGLSLLPGPGAACPFGGAPLLGAIAAHLEVRFGGNAAAPGASPLCGARRMTLAEEAIVRLLLRGVPVGHDGDARSARVAGGENSGRADPPILYAGRL